ncbi:MAG: TIGR04086 family membrane protein [Ruminococcaceae bacterium]|nr:TIGR04086 family membrane protein [Oscillospiraceae bacterium]
MNIIDLRRSVISALVGIILTVILFLLFTLLTAMSIIPDGAIKTISIIITVFSAFASGFLTSKNVYEYGLLNGLATGLIYFLMLFVLSIIVTLSFSFTSSLFIRFLLIIIASGFGGILGINVRANRQRQRRRRRSAYRRV